MALAAGRRRRPGANRPRRGLARPGAAIAPRRAAGRDAGMISAPRRVSAAASAADGAQAAALAPVRTHMLGAARAEADRIVEGRAPGRRDRAAARPRRGPGRPARRGAGPGGRRRGRGCRTEPGPPTGPVDRARRAASRHATTYAARSWPRSRGCATEPGYERLLARLTALATAAAGPDATITAAPAGGVVARSRGVVVDCTLARLADLAVDALGDEVRELWTP